jgi:hypothetical protein
MKHVLKFVPLLVITNVLLLCVAHSDGISTYTVVYSALMVESKVQWHKEVNYAVTCQAIED